MGTLLRGKIAKIVIYEKRRVNGAVTNYDSAVLRWVPKLVMYNAHCKLKCIAMLKCKLIQGGRTRKWLQDENWKR